MFALADLLSNTACEFLDIKSEGVILIVYYKLLIIIGPDVRSQSTSTPKILR